MKKVLFSLVAACALWAYAGGGLIANAQDLPTQPPESVTATPAPEVTDVVGVPPVEKTAEATAEPTKEPTPAPLFNPATAGELLLFLGLSALAGGGIVAIVLGFLGKKEVRDRVEDARNSWSPEQQAMLANFTNLFERVTSGTLDFLKAIQDGKPNVDAVAAQVMQSPQLKAHIDSAVNTAVNDKGSVG